MQPLWCIGTKKHGIERSTFLMDADNKVVHKWRKVKIAGHVDEVLAQAKALVAGK